MWYNSCFCVVAVVFIWHFLLQDGTLNVDHYITHTFSGVDKTNEAIKALHGKDCLRAVVEYV